MSKAKSLHRVVVGVDSVPRSDAPLNVAIDLARRFDAEIEIVHGVKPPHHLWPDLSPHDVGEARKAIQTRLEASLSGARLDFVSSPHRLVVQLTSHPAQLLMQRVSHPEADLLVVGRHRRHGVMDFGGTLRAVLASAPCPVWVQSGPVRVVRRILVPVDLSSESLAALRHACAWAVQLEARVHVVHCFQQPELFAGHGYPAVGPTYVIDQLCTDARKEFEEEMESFDWAGADHTVEFVEDDPTACILDRQDDIDLVMMGSHGRTGLSATLLGNVALSVVRDGHVPVVVMRHPEREWVL
jgi:nucleotide-binding universal stress UspA family protein